MEIIKPRTLSGFMELLPGKQIRFEKMMEILRTTYASYGFAPLDTHLASPGVPEALNLPKALVAQPPTGGEGDLEPQL